MFKKLKMRLLFMNIILIVVIMLIAFTSVYMLTYNNTERMIDNMFREVGIFKPIRDDFFKLPPPVNEETDDRLFALSVALDTDQTIVTVTSTFEAEDSLYHQLVDEALENPNLDRITIQETTWAYKTMVNENGTMIHFIDITTHVDLLNRLIMTFVGVSIVTIIVIVITSNFLTNQSIKPVKEAFDKQNTFISDASHELKTPLAVIQSNTDVLSRQYDLKDNKQIVFIQDEIKRMKQLTENLLDLSRLDFSNSEAYDTLNISESFEAILLNFESIAYEKNIQMDYDLDADVYIKGKQDELIQVLMILLDNALKFSTEKIHVSLKKNHQHALLKVQNSGQDIPDEDKPMIFDRFYKADHARSNASGYGLGLSIAKKIIHHHKGKLNYKYENHMNTFVIKIPTIIIS